MKKIAYSLFAAAFVALSGCQDDVVVEEPVVPAQTGDEITFGSSLENTEATDTRTIYGDNIETDADGNRFYPVTWEDGDRIAIYCPQAAQGNMVNYEVIPDPADASHSSAVTKVNSEQAGLQWGTEETHKFSAFYPADRILGNENGKLKGEIPVNQDPVEWKKTPNGDGSYTYTGVANTDYAFMWAYNEHDKSNGGDVALEFKPWVTILDVEINGPANAGESVKMSSVQLRATDYTTLTGEFLIDFTKVEQNPTDPDAAPGYIASGNTSSTRSQLSIQLYADKITEDGQEKDFNDFITLNHGDKIVVRFYLLPKDTNYDTSETPNLQIRVSPFNSSVLTRTLNAAQQPDGSSQTGGILAHKVNKVILPPVSQSGNNYWMSSLNPGIFVTELSLPGSKMSYQTTANGAHVAYQNLSIADQVQNGIRAFQIQTASTNTAIGWDSGDANDQDLYMVVAGSKSRTTRFRDIVEEIATGLKVAEGENRPNEYAFILVTPETGQCDSYGGAFGYGETSGEQAWMDAVQNELEYMTQAGNEDTYRIYTNEITPSTTINDVKGHIIIKVNYNNDNMANHLADNANIPALFAQWGVRNDIIQTDFTEVGAYAINAMRWGTSRNVDDTNLQWFYHESTPIGYNGDSGGEWGETSIQKIANIEDMWNRSISYYTENNAHNIWYFNDLGGSYVNGGRYDSGESQAGVDAWTEHIGPYATNLLQNRTADATLGIVLMNFADPNDEYTGNLIQTIINNNFNFQLRTDGSQQPETYSTPTRTSSNGWDE